jgi:hypothetical protein
MELKAPAAALLALLVVALPVAADENLSAPNRVPDLSDFKTPQIVPGSSGTYQFTVRNRYNGTMENASLTVEIYKWATLEDAKDIGRISEPPRISGGVRQNYSTPVFSLASNGTETIKVTISTSGQTPEGTYFVRQMVRFSYNGNELLMKSRGYFTSREWDNATTNVNGTRAVGGINLTMLGVDGLLPDSSFSVKEPIPVWPLALLIGLTVFFGALALVFYLMEEKGHPVLKKGFYKGAGKLKQTRRLTEQELRKLRRGVDVPLRRDEGK